MPNPFDQMVRRMDAVTVKKMGKSITIDGRDYAAVPAELLAEMGPLTGDGISLVIFSDEYRPMRNHPVLYEGEEYSVSRWEKYNGKWRIWIE